MRTATRCSNCQPVLFKHEDGWDIYPASECLPAPDGTLVPAWFDAPLVEDEPTRKAALAELAEWHPHGFCLWRP